MRLRGEQVRVDDTPEVLTKRLANYRAQTEPLIHYYSERRKLLTVDGMMTIEHVTQEINRILAAIGASETRAPKKPAKAKPATRVVRQQGRKVSKSAPNTAKKAPKVSRKAGKKASKGVKKPAKSAVRKGASSSGRRPVAGARRAAKKVTKRRAKA
jgi:adenylate kinase